MRNADLYVYVGIDPAAESFTATLCLGPQRFQSAAQPFANTGEGIAAFAPRLEAQLEAQGARAAHSLIGIENTGVYSEVLCYALHERGYRLSLLDPAKIWKAFPKGQAKSDALDSRKVAEYAWRYADSLTLWQPQPVILEQVRVILSTREQLVEQKIATQNARHALARKVIQTPAANQALETTLAHLQAQIQRLEAELKRLIRSHPTLLHGVNLLLSAPGVGWLLAAHFLVLSEGFTRIPRYRSLAQYLGISPNEHTSGTSVRKRGRSRRYGPSMIRKLLHLAARSLSTHEASARQYFQEKTAQGKEKRLVLNNIANKLVKRLCAMLRDGTPYMRDHRPVAPSRLALA